MFLYIHFASTNKYTDICMSLKAIIFSPTVSFCCVASVPSPLCSSIIPNEWGAKRRLKVRQDWSRETCLQNFVFLHFRCLLNVVWIQVNTVCILSCPVWSCNQPKGPSVLPENQPCVQHSDLMCMGCFISQRLTILSDIFLQTQAKKNHAEEKTFIIFYFTL